MAPDPYPPQFLTTGQVADRAKALGLPFGCAKTVIERIQDGTLKGRKLAGRWLVSRRWLERYTERLLRAAEGGA